MLSPSFRKWIGIILGTIPALLNVQSTLVEAQEKKQAAKNSVPQLLEYELPKGSAAESSWLYGIDLGDNTGSSTLSRITPSTAEISVIGETGFDEISDIAFLPNGQLFGLRFRLFDTALVIINPRTAEATRVGNGIGFDEANALVWDRDQSFFAATVGGEFVRVDPFIGEGTLIGEYGSGLGSAGDLAFGPGGTLFGTAFTGGVCCSPTVLVQIDTKTGLATEIGAIGFDGIFGLEFQSKTILIKGQMSEVLREPTLYAVTNGGVGETPQIISIDQSTGEGTLVGPVQTGDIISGLAANIRLPATQGKFRIVGFDESDVNNDCNHIGDSWTVCQHKDGLTHKPGVQADDTYAWDLNLSMDKDQGKSVFSVAPGKVVSFYNETPPGGGTESAVLVEHCLRQAPCNCNVQPTDCWWSRYLHMEDIQVIEGQSVDNRTVLGFISNISPNPIPTHLHLAVYEGENRRENGQGLLKSVDVLFVAGSSIFREGFESGNLNNWSSIIPQP